MILYSVMFVYLITKKIIVSTTSNFSELQKYNKSNIIDALPELSTVQNVHYLQGQSVITVHAELYPYDSQDHGEARFSNTRYLLWSRLVAGMIEINSL